MYIKVQNICLSLKLFEHILKYQYIYGRTDFAKVSKNLARYKFENNFVGPSK